MPSPIAHLGAGYAIYQLYRYRLPPAQRRVWKLPLQPAMVAGLSMLPVFFSDWPMLLFPVHIVFLELIIDPSCSLIFEAEEAESNVMERPPRSANERLFSLATVGLAVLQGLSALAACVAVFLFSAPASNRTHPTP